MPSIRQPIHYLYALSLTASGWAWEFLRRNPGYRIAWSLELQAARRARARPPGVRTREPVDRAAPWGLRYLEPPSRPGSIVVPFWRADAIPAPARVGALGGTATPDEFLDLFAAPGNKAVCLTPEGAYAVLEIGRTTARVLFTDPSDLRDRMPIEIRMGNAAEREAGLRYLVRSDPAAASRFAPANPRRLMQQLQALDGRLVGASLRQIAEAVYGPEPVAGDWNRPDGVLERRTRYLVERGAMLMNGGYRRLLKPLGTQA